MLDLRLPGLLTRAAARLVTPIAGALVVALLPLVAYAGTITVNGTTCTLPDAITAANTDAVAGGCTAGSGDDTLLLGGLTHSLATGPFNPNGEGLTATPSITTTIIISGGISGSIVERSGPTEFRLFYVDEPGNLTLQKVTVRFGNLSDKHGGAILNDSVLTLFDSQIISNTGFDGGGIQNTGIISLFNSTIISNTANDDGGAINSESVSSKIHLTNSFILSNKATDEGGGIFTYGFITTTTFLTDTIVRGNVAGDDGGGISNDFSFLSLTRSSVISNTATGGGGGIYNAGGGKVSLTDSFVISNTADDEGGGLFNNGDDLNATMILTSTIVRGNFAGAEGGGISVDASFVGLTNSSVISNTANSDGGGIYNDSKALLSLTNSAVSNNRAGINGGGIHNTNTSTVTVVGGEIRANHAITVGGGLYNGTDGKMTVTGAKIQSNGATTMGGALYQASGQSSVEESCIVNNTDTAVVHAGGSVIDAANNWWGAPDGPSGAGPGGGDSVSSNVTFAPVLTTAPDDCVLSVAFGKRTSAAGDVLPGQPLSYTLTITNDGTLNIKNLNVSDVLPADFYLLTTQTTGPAISVNGSSFVIPDLLPSQVATITLVGQVNPTLSGDTVLSNTATLTNALTGVLTATASNNVVVPLVGWAQEAYETSADSDTFTATVTVSPTNPYISVTVQVVITDSVAAVVAADVQEITFPPGSSSQPVVVTVANVEADAPRTIQLGLQSPAGISLGKGSSVTATLTVTKGAQSGAIYLPKVQR